MKVLIIGSGAREHALAWKVRQSPLLQQLYVAPGNLGTASLSDTENIPIEADSIRDLVHWAKAHAIDLTIVGPEKPLSAGIFEAFTEQGLLLFGPSKQAALLEGSKIWAKQFLLRHHIPTASAEAFDSFQPARRHAKTQPSFPLVIKADGLAQGKGVVVADSPEQAERALHTFLQEKALGDAGARVLIESYLEGEELSAFALCDGERFCYIGEARDYKRAFDNDEGPNTGGMGAISASDLIDEGLRQTIQTKIFMPTLKGLLQEGIPYQGFLYAGLKLTSDGPKVLEFNVRFGDPEAQVILPRLKQDLLPLLLAAAKGRLTFEPPALDSRAAVGVVIAADGYPERYSKGIPLPDFNEFQNELRDEILFFQSGTELINGKPANQGGRTLTAVARGETLEVARKSIYGALARKSWDGYFYRKDIGAISSKAKVHS